MHGKGTNELRKRFIFHIPPNMNPATRRLSRDLEEVKRNPLPIISAAPVNDDLFRWHVNLRADASSSVMPGTVVHLVVTFSEDYPRVAPKITMSTPLPHRNVVVHGHSFSLCLDMLEMSTNGDAQVFNHHG